jgi:hypothetical protein
MQSNANTTHAMSVRLSPFYDQLLCDLQARSGLRNKSQVIYTSINFVFEVMMRAQGGRTVMRSYEQQRQKGLCVSSGPIEQWTSGNLKLEGESSSLRLNLPYESHDKLQQLVNSGFSPNSSEAIRRALVWLDYAVQHANAGWEFGWLDGTGAFHLITLSFAVPRMASMLCVEDGDEFQRILNFMVKNIELHLHEILAKARYYNQDAKGVANEFLNGGYQAISGLRVLEQCNGDLGRCVGVLSELATGEYKAEKPSFVVAIESVEDIEREFLGPILAHLAEGIPTYLIHYSESSLLSLANTIREESSCIDSTARTCFFVEVEKNFFKKKGQFIVSNHHSRLLRCGIEWTPSSGSPQRYQVLSEENLQQFNDQIEPYIRLKASELNSGMKSLGQLWAV